MRFLITVALMFTSYCAGAMTCELYNRISEEIADEIRLL